VNNNVIFLGLLVYLSVQYETDANPYSDEKIADKSKKRVKTVNVINLCSVL